MIQTYLFLFVTNIALGSIMKVLDLYITEILHLNPALSTSSLWSRWLYSITFVIMDCHQCLFSLPGFSTCHVCGGKSASLLFRLCVLDSVFQEIACNFDRVTKET